MICKYKLEKDYKCSFKVLTFWLVMFLFLVLSFNSYAKKPPPNIGKCKSKWTVMNSTSGMQFGDFAVEQSSGTITLNTGSSRTSSASIDLLTAGAAVNSHQIVIDNTEDPVVCASYGIDIDWIANPDGTNMTGLGAPIGISTVKIYINGVETALPTGPVTSYTLPLDVEIVSTMTTANIQTSDLYTSATYEIGLTQSGKTTSTTGVANTTAHTPLSLTAGVTMDFGQISSGSSGGTIILNESSGARSVGSGDADVVLNASAGTPGAFTIQGDAGLVFTISYTNGSLTNSAGGNAISISNFTDTTSAITLTGGVDPFTVGATLTLSGSQPAGDYSTQNPGGVPYSITVNYN